RDFADAERAKVVLGVTRSYREAMRGFAAMRNLDLWYARLDLGDFAAQLSASRDSKQAKAVLRSATKARTKDSMKALSRLTTEVEASVLEPALGKSPYANHGQRIVEGQRLMQATSDIFLGWVRNPKGLDGRARDFYIRQLWDWKTSVDLEAILPRGLELYAQA